MEKKNERGVGKEGERDEERSVFFFFNFFLIKKEKERDGGDTSYFSLCFLSLIFFTAYF